MVQVWVVFLIVFPDHLWVSSLFNLAGSYSGRATAPSCQGLVAAASSLGRYLLPLTTNGTRAKSYAIVEIKNTWEVA